MAEALGHTTKGVYIARPARAQAPRTLFARGVATTDTLSCPHHDLCGVPFLR